MSHAVACDREEILRPRKQRLYGRCFLLYARYYALVKTLYLGLGSNVGDRGANLKRAVALLAPEILVTEISPVYETKPMYTIDQSNFLNGVCEATTKLSAWQVFEKIKMIEKKMGEHEHNAPRVIDLDLLLYGDEIIDSPELTIPHAGLRERDFVLKPLCDITSELREPISGKTMCELWEALPQESRSIVGLAHDVR